MKDSKYTSILVSSHILARWGQYRNPALSKVKKKRSTIKNNTRQKSELSSAEDKICIYFLTQLNYMVVTNHTATVSANIYHQISWFVPSLVLYIHSLNLQLFFLLYEDNALFLFRNFTASKPLNMTLILLLPLPIYSFVNSICLPHRNLGN